MTWTAATEVTTIRLLVDLCGGFPAAELMADRAELKMRMHAVGPGDRERVRLPAATLQFHGRELTAIVSRKATMAGDDRICF